MRKRGGEGSYPSKTYTMTIRIDEKTMQQIDEARARLRIWGKSELIRVALGYYLDHLLADSYSTVRTESP